jgi:hypothetical protein
MGGLQVPNWVMVASAVSFSLSIILVLLSVYKVSKLSSLLSLSFGAIFSSFMGVFVFHIILTQLIEKLAGR